MAESSLFSCTVIGCYEIVCIARKPESRTRCAPHTKRDDDAMTAQPNNVIGLAVSNKFLAMFFNRSRLHKEDRKLQQGRDYRMSSTSTDCHSSAAPESCLSFAPARSRTSPCYNLDPTPRSRLHPEAPPASRLLDRHNRKIEATRMHARRPRSRRKSLLKVRREFGSAQCGCW